MGLHGGEQKEGAEVRPWGHARGGRYGSAYTHPLVVADCRRLGVHGAPGEESDSTL